jgi:thioredoxin 1
MASFKDLTQSDKPVLIDFYADWCGPCKMVPPILQEVKKKLGDRVNVIKIDVDQNQSLAQRLNIAGVPTLMIYQKGEQKFRRSGVASASDLVKQLEPLLAAH